MVNDRQWGMVNSERWLTIRNDRQWGLADNR